MYYKPCHPMMKTLEVDVFLCFEGMNQHPAPLASYCSRISKTAPAVHSSCGTLGVAKQPEECTQFWNPLIRFEVQTSVKHPFEKRMAPLLPMQQPKCRHLCMLVAWQAGGPSNAQMELHCESSNLLFTLAFSHTSSPSMIRQTLKFLTYFLCQSFSLFQQEAVLRFVSTAHPSQIATCFIKLFLMVRSNKLVKFFH